MHATVMSNDYNQRSAFLARIDIWACRAMVDGRTGRKSREEARREEGREGRKGALHMDTSSMVCDHL